MGLKKKQRTAEWHQQQVNQEVTSRVDSLLKNVEEKKDEGSGEVTKEEER